LVHGMVAWLVRAWWVGVLVWFGIRLVVGAWYGGMAGKNLVGALLQGLLKMKLSSGKLQF
jgi:hypothetical protein